MENEVFHVTISRVHKSSPYNCVGYIPEIKAPTMEDVINLPEVDNLINKTYGKKLTVIVDSNRTIDFLEYDVIKPKAIIK